MAGTAEQVLATATAPLRNTGFPYRRPTVPRGVEVPAEPPSLGADYDTAWARSPTAKAARNLIVAGPQRLLIDAVADPEINGHDRLADLLGGDDDARPTPVIFAPNHHSHLDTALMVRAVPGAWRRHLVTAAAADYFFDKRWKATLAALALNAIPVDREVTNRRSADLMAGLIDEGWSLVIYPEGGRSPDGWGQSFRGGAAYLAGRTGAPVVPVYIDGTDSIMGKGTSVPKPGRTRVTFGNPLRRRPEESTRRFNDRIAAAVATLADESTSDFWSARRRAAAGATPTLMGPAYTGWRRRWALADRRRRGIAGWRTPARRRWPDLG
ncbi:MAG TPA: lysophospholipid acyltransferase family protein [Desertimonas sp.]|nr:lysophospholipid acyltransferase family protein [Desertimonas sp.]